MRHAAETQPQPETPSPQRPAHATTKPTDLAIVLSHYDIGVIASINLLSRGTPRFPKYAVRAERGDFVLKRRKEPRAQIDRVAFTQSVHTTLASAGYPTPAVIQTKRRGGLVVFLNERLYELIQFVHGDRYDLSHRHTFEAGRHLALMHRAAAGIEPRGQPVTGGTYHDADGLREALRSIDPAEHPDAAGDANALAELADEALNAARGLGVDGWPDTVIHADWHPGNLLFNEHTVAGVLDFDTARLAPRAIDLALGALQFSLTSRTENPAEWPEHADTDRLRAFVEGYDAETNPRTSKAEIEALPHLMIEALIAEAAGPLRRTPGRADDNAATLLAMARRKAQWIRENIPRLRQLLA